MYPTDTKHHLDRKNLGTEGVVETGREEDNPTGMVSPAPAVDFQLVVDPM